MLDSDVSNLGGLGEGRRAPAPNYLSIVNLTKKYGPITVVDNLNLSTRKGEFISILGPSGCGKTTTLRMIAGLVQGTSGQIIVDERRIDVLPTHRRDAAMVFQNYALFPHMTVANNIAYGLRNRKVTKTDIDARVSSMLDLVGLSAHADKYPSELSGGQQQRVALGRALVLNPKLLLLDEPLSNLDAKLRKQLRSELKTLHQQCNATTIFVTHDLDEALSLSDRVAVMNAGRLEQFATPVEIFTKPSSRFVADFVGHSNIFEGEVRSEAGRHVLGHGTQSIAVAAPTRTGKQHIAAVPAAKIRLLAAGENAANKFDGAVQHVSYLGGRIQFVVGNDRRTITVEQDLSANRLVPKANDKVSIGWEAGDEIFIGN